MIVKAFHRAYGESFRIMDGAAVAAVSDLARHAHHSS